MMSSSLSTNKNKTPEGQGIRGSASRDTQRPFEIRAERQTATRIDTDAPGSHRRMLVSTSPVGHDTELLAGGSLD